MTTAVASVPSTTTAPAAAPAPSPAPAPASASDQPAWAAEGGVSDFLSGVTSERPAAAPAPSTRMEPKRAETPAPAPAEPAAAAPAATTAAPETPKPAEPANPAPAAPAAAATTEILLAGRFKAALPGVDKDPGVQELAKAYDASGKEARRLLQVAAESKAALKAKDAAIAEREAQLEALKLEKQLGPEIVDPAPEESANWTPKQWADHSVAKLKREQLKEKLEAQKKQSEASAKADGETRTRDVFARMEHMSKSEDEFPGFNDYMKEDENGRGPIADWLPLLPMLSGHPIAPLALYLIAKGHESLQKDKASAAASKKANEDAKALAAASLPAAAGAGGAPGAQPEPSKPAPTEDDSDEGHNAKLIAAHSWSKPLLPID